MGKNHTNLKRRLIVGLIVVFGLVGSGTAWAANTTYYWVGGATGTLSTTTTTVLSTTKGGSAASVTLATSDGVIFDGSNIGGGLTGTVTLTVGSALSIAQLIYQNSASVIFTATSSRIITINGGTGTDLSIDATSAFSIGANAASSGSAITVNLSTGTTGTISGTLSIGNIANTSQSAHTVTVVDANSITVTGIVIYNLSSSTKPFGSTSTGGWVFASGSTCKGYKGGDIFSGSTNVVTFQTGSTYEYDGTSASYLPFVAATAAQTYSYFIFNTPALNPSATFSFTVDNISLASTATGALTLDMNNLTLNIKGNLINNNSTYNFQLYNKGTGTATYNFNGSNQKILSNAGGITFGQASATKLTAININSGTIVNLGDATTLGGNFSVLQYNTLTVSGTVDCGIGSGNNGGILSGAGAFVLSNGGILKTSNSTGVSGSITTTIKTFNSGGSYVFNAANITPFGSLVINTPKDLTINAAITLDQDVTLSGTLNLAANLIIGTKNLTLASGNAVSGTLSTGKHIVANSTGVVSSTYASGSSYTFPVGYTASIYNPVTISNTSGGSQTYTVKTTAISPSQNNSLPYMWVIGGSTGTCDLAFGWNTADALGNLASTPTSGKAFNGTSFWTPQTSSTAVGSGIDYNTSVSGTTLANPINWTVGVITAPTTQTSTITFSNIAATGMTLGLTRGNGSSVAIFVKDGSVSITNPSDNTTYTASSNWNSGSPSGTQLGSSGYYCVYNGNPGSGTQASVVPLINLQSGHTYYVQAYEYNGTAGSEKYNTATATGNPNSQLAFIAPSITKDETGYTSNLGMVAAGSNSSYQSFNVQGSDLTDDITVTPPTSDFKVSKDHSTWSNTVAVTPAEAASPYTVYVHYSPTSATGLVSGNITLSTPSGTNVTVAVSGTSIAAEPTTQGTISFGTTTTTSVVVNFTSGDGGNRLIVAKSGSAPTGTPVDGSSFTGNAAFGSAPALGDGVVVYSGTANTVTVTGLTSTNTYYFTVYEYSVGTGNSQNYLLTSPDTKSTVLAPTVSLLSGSISQVVKQNVAITSIVYTTTGNVISAGCTGLPAGVTFDFGTYTISGTPTTSTYQAYPYTVTVNGVNGSTTTTTGTITVKDPNAKKVAFLTTSSAPPTGSNKLITALQGKYDVTIITASNTAADTVGVSQSYNGTATPMTDLKSNYDLIVLHELVTSTNLTAVALGRLKGVVPILNTKAHMYGKTNWPTGTGNNGASGDIDINILSGYSSHPIFNGVSVTGNVAILANSGGIIRYVNSTSGTANTLVTSNSKLIALNHGNSAGNYSIIEDNILLTHGKKYMLIALSATTASQEDFTSNGLLVMTNACDHLMAQSIFASAGSNGSISSDGETDVASSGSKVYTITPNAGYHVADVLVDGSSVGAVTSYTFSNVTVTHTISATFVSGYVWTGAIDNSFTNGGNWQGGSAPTAGNGSEILVQTGTTLPLANTSVFGNINIGTGSILDLNGKSLTINGVITGLGTIDATSGTLIYNGSAAQTISNLKDNTANNITISNSAGVVLNNALTTGSLIINSSSILTVNPGKQLTVNTAFANSGTINLKSDINGTATILTPATTGTGTANVEQYLATTRNWYISSPVSNAIPPSSGYTFYERNEAAVSWPSISTTNFVPGRGYIALPGLAAGVITFSTETGGSLNTGNVDVDLTFSGSSSKGFNLIGNPYPSHLTWTKAFTDANASLIEPSIYYRTNTGSVNSGGDAAWSYPTYNAFSNEAALGGSAIIPPMQAFWVRAVAVGKLTFNSDLTKSHQTSNPLKAPALKATDRQRLRLQVDNGTTKDEALIYFDTNASDAFDRYDSPKFSEANTVTQIYTTAGTEKLVINGMNAIPLNQEIGLGFVPGNATSFSIKANEISNLPSDVKVILKDNVTLAETDLTDGTSVYEFTPVTTTGNRFSVIFRSSSTVTGIDTNFGSDLFVGIDANNQIRVNGFKMNGGIVTVCNAIGQRLASVPINGTGTVIRQSLSSGVYLVTVTNAGCKITKKVIIR